ncbi:syndecan-4 [Neoarius graeffei]|uniref:syndecan-4 n=1 Tax=Neoarius graeffei TaxID=443677 RepID=UPI00298C8A2C|nr:syndecan-4 [Neoarius graeffei]
MLKVSLVFVLLAAAAFAESVRETETWMPPKAGESHDDLDSSGDFIFPKEDSTLFDDEDAKGYDDASGSGDESFVDGSFATSEHGEFDNHIPDISFPVQPQPTDNEIQPVMGNKVAHPPSVRLSHAGEQNIFNKTEVLAAVIAGGAVGLLFAVLLILLLVYRMKKKDEGSYDLSKKPIYKKAPTTEIYA